MPLPSGARLGSIVSGCPHDDRRLGRQQAALGLVDGARDAVEAGRHVHDGRLREPLVAVPARRLGEREVDLHLGPAVAEAAARRGDRVRRVCRAGGRRAASASRSRSRRATRRPSRRRPCARRRAAPSRTTTESTSTPVRHEPPLSSISRTSASARRAPPPRGTGMPPSWTATAITCAMNPDDAVSGPRPVWSTHGASRPWIRSEANVSQSQSRPETSRLPPNSATPCRPSRRIALPPSAMPVRRPELGAEQPEREVGVRHEPGEQLAPRGAVAGRVAVELRGVRVGAAEQERRLAVGERGRRRQLGVQVLEAARGELVAEQRRAPRRRPRADASPRARRGGSRAR